MMEDYVNSSVLVNDDLCDHVEMKREDKPICSVRGANVDVRGINRFHHYFPKIFSSKTDFR